VRFFHDKRGTASSIVGVATIVLALSLCALLVDVGFLYLRRDDIKRGLDASNMAVFREIDQERLADGVLWIDPIAGADTFRLFLERNLRLDPSLDPLPGSPASGPVVIEEFHIYNPSDLPAVDPLGHPVSEVSVYSQIRVPVRPLFIGLFRPVALRVAVLTDIPD